MGGEMKLALMLAALLGLCSAYSIWPQPVEFARLGNRQLSLLPSKLQVVTSTNSPVLKDAIARYLQYFFPYPASGAPPGMLLTTLNITVQNNSNIPLQFGVDETYSLTVQNDYAEIVASTVWGALHGLESFSQLIDLNYKNKTYSIADTPVYVYDYPRFPWRGLLIDASRHFLSIPTILEIIDGLAINKMNVLHWHISDSQAFPLQVQKYPNLAQAGAYEFPAATYTYTDVKNVIAYANARGVRVVPEFDIPGHSYSWGLGYPLLTLNCSPPVWGVDGVTLDITSNYTYSFLTNFLKDVKPIFPDNYFHFGSDEVVFDCWNESTIVKDWMKMSGIPTFELALQYFEDQLAVITNNVGIQQRVFWEDPFAEHNVTFNPVSTVLEIWISLDSMVKAVQQGYRTILAQGFYLDVQNPTADFVYAWVDTWRDFYSNEPFAGAGVNLTTSERALVIGGEACMWGEAVEDENILTEIFVRSSGAAEKLWSTMNYTTNPDWDSAQSRLQEFSCRLKRKGVRGCPVVPSYCPAPTRPSRR